jgi:hypothetical protein
MPPQKPNTSPAELAPTPEASLAESLTAMAHRVDRMEAELGAFAGTNTYPEWWYQYDISTTTIMNGLKDKHTDPSRLTEYFQLSTRERAARAAIAGPEHEEEMTTFTSLYNELGVDVVARGFSAEGIDGPLHTFVAERLKGATESGHTLLELDVLRQAYGKSSITELLGIAGDEYSSGLRPLLHSRNAIKMMRAIDQERSGGDTHEDTQLKSREWMSKALSIADGIDEAEAADYVFAASRQGDRDDADEVFGTILDRFDVYGTERLRGIATFTGIHSFENYSVDQLNLMEELLNDPEGAAERLAKHDVTVVMVNRVGDHNGVLHDTAEKFEDGNGRTLFFEINNMTDIYRHMLKLQKLGIKPSTLVLSAHSAPGQFIVSDRRDPSMKRRDIATVAGRNLVRHANDGKLLDAGDFGYSMHGMKGMARLVDELMQPSRAIDDAEEDMGRKKVLFQACDAASEVESKDIDDEGVKFSMGMDSVVSRLGNDLLENNIRSDVDIYGAPSGIQLHKSERGVSYTSSPDTLDEERKHQHAIRIRLADGELTRQDADEMAMHR